ncbi:beta-ketoacyl synthase N-terminal-like domain-containing protein [Nocardia otitidiscaviarum]|uniref:beta-ketoacyl synthase N-terminal-like domain-containing protein n=1 Tax=Nocardia otitidiscaviarum TaxID=1823 RepID=UPI0024584E45|nr:beta-ketoacyl synthase N-terminal-like domain-containing protein [Nocardia otitidiscaviarum]
MTRTDCVVTGIDVLAPTGLTVDEYWRRTCLGESGIRVVDDFDRRYRSALAGVIPDFVARDHLPGRLIAQTDRVTQLALVAAERAFADAKVDLDHRDPFECAVVTSNATGGFEFSHREMRRLWTEGRESVSVYQCFAWFYAVNTGQISIRHRLRGPGAVLVAEQSGGLDALGHARRIIRRGRCSMAIAGGMESSFDPWGWVSHQASGALSPAREPAAGYRPFSPAADGYVPGEGGAMLVLEACDTVELGTVYGRIAGYASGFDPRDDPTYTRPLHRVLTTALADAELRPGDIDVVFADAAGTRAADKAEATVLAEVFGPHGVPVAAPKSGTGRLMAGAGPLDVVCALLALRDNVIPPAPQVPSTDLPIDLVCGRARATPLTTALVLARGAGGFHSALVLRK